MHLVLRRRGVLSMTCNFGRHYLSRAHDEAVTGALEEAFHDAARAVAAEAGSSPRLAPAGG
jgi:hypothetical protein